MSELTPPFVVSEGGDLMAFDRLDDVESQVEAYDVDGYEFFDANGQRLVATVERDRVQLQADLGIRPEPERLEAMLRSYFAELGARQQRFAGYTSEANSAVSLHELLELRLKLANEPGDRFWSRARRRLSGHEDDASA